MARHPEMTQLSSTVLDRAKRVRRPAFLWLLPALCSLGALTSPLSSDAAPAPLPYTRRVLGFSSWTGTIRGDIRTIGMAGATLGLADTFIGAGDNPAGLAMTLPGSGIQFTTNRVYDGNVQDIERAMATSNAGMMISSYPWGFSAGYWTPQYEGMAYSVGGSSTETGLEVDVREIRLAAARLVIPDKLAVGLGVTFGEGGRLLASTDPNIPLNAYYSRAIGVTLGAMWQFPRRWLLGLSYSAPMIYRVDQIVTAPVGVTDFFQPIATPYRLGLGAGWIPNRYFRVGFSLMFIGTTHGSALLSDETRTVGSSTTLQPRAGVSYLAADYKELTVQASIGSYLEGSRISGHSDRVHFTGGLEIAPWIFSLGWGIDVSKRYSNYLISIGIDFPKLARKLDLLPGEWRPPYAGFLPRPTRLSEEGLPRPLVRNWRARPEGESPLESAEKLPDRIENKIQEVGQSVSNIGKGVLGVFGIESKSKKKKKPSKTKPGAPTQVSPKARPSARPPR